MRQLWKMSKHCKQWNSISHRLLQTWSRKCLSHSTVNRSPVFDTRNLIVRNGRSLSSAPTMPELTSVRYPHVKRGAFEEVTQESLALLADNSKI